MSFYVKLLHVGDDNKGLRLVIFFFFFPFYTNVFMYKWLMLAFTTKNYFVMVYVIKRQYFISFVLIYNKK
jgi:hypothetical protein